MSLFLLLTFILSVQPINQSYPYQEIILILCSKLFHCGFQTVVLKDSWSMYHCLSFPWHSRGQITRKFHWCDTMWLVCHSMSHHHTLSNKDWITVLAKVKESSFALHRTLGGMAAICYISIMFSCSILSDSAMP